MSSNSLPLLLTDIGATRLKELIAKGSHISLMIAIGDGDQVPNKETQTLANQREITKPSLLSAIDVTKNSWHINANFKPNGEQFDINEIGLLINEEKSQQDNTLLGIYFEKNGLAKKMPKTDLFIDMVVNMAVFSETIPWQDYQPSFSLPEATNTAYGAVKLASNEDIKNQHAGLALSTDNLQTIYLNVKKSKEASWQIIYNSTLDGKGLYQPMGLFSLQGIIYGLMIKAKQATAKDFLFIRYNMGDKVVSRPMSVNDAIVNVEAKACGFKNNTISWLVYKAPDIAQNSAWQLETPITGAEKIAKVSNKIAFKNKVNTGSLVFYNQRACVIGGISKPLTQLLIGNEEYNQELSLTYPRKMPLVQVIQDKIYCLGGGDANQPLVEMHKISFAGDKLTTDPFVPENTIKLDLSDTEEFTSCVFENRIYVFKTANYHAQSEDLSFHYYNYLSNTWQSSTIPTELFKNNDLAPQYGKAVSDGQAIYLFCTKTHESNTQLSVIKFIPD